VGVVSMCEVSWMLGAAAESRSERSLRGGVGSVSEDRGNSELRLWSLVLHRARIGRL
jgi:hypothetical protein